MMDRLNIEGIIHDHCAESAKLLDFVNDIALELLPLREAVHTNASLPTTIINRLREAGVFRVLQPACFGGLELSIDTFFAIQRLLSQSCMSAGWLSGIWGLQAWQLALFDARAQAEVWSEGDALISSAFMPTGNVVPAQDGFLLNGRWRYSSGAPHSTWMLLGGLVNVDGESPDYRAFLLPRSDYKVIDDWHTVGMRATESHGVLVNNIFVPSYRTFRAVDGFHCDCPGHAIHTNPIYRMPFGQLFALAISLPSVGALEGAISFGSKQIKGCTVPGIAPMQLALSDAHSISIECRRTADMNLNHLAESARVGSIPALHERARMRFDAARLSSRCVQAINGLFQAQGSRSLSLSNQISQAWLDINAAHLHAGNNFGRFNAQYYAALQGEEVKDYLI